MFKKIKEISTATKMRIITWMAGIGILASPVYTYAAGSSLSKAGEKVGKDVLGAISWLILVVTLGVGALMVAKKEYSKLIAILAVGGLLYVITVGDGAILKTIGGWITSQFN